MPRKTQTAGSDFGKRLVELRKARAMTQVQLAEAIGATQRAISYYENEASYPPAQVVVELARALKVTTDELLGVESAPAVERKQVDPETRRMWKRFQRLRNLPEKDQRAVIRLISSLVGEPSSS